MRGVVKLSGEVTALATRNELSPRAVGSDDALARRPWQTAPVRARPLFAWLPVLAFPVAFFLGYRDSPRPGEAEAVVWSLVLVAVAAAAWFGTGGVVLRVFVVLNSLGAGFCAMGILDNVFNHNSYSGYGALVLLPLAALCWLAMFGTAIGGTVRALRTPR